MPNAHETPQKIEKRLNIRYIEFKFASISGSGLIIFFKKGQNHCSLH